MKRNRLFSFIALCASVFIFVFGIGSSRSAMADNDKPLTPKVLVIAMFGSEAEFWIANEGLTEQVAVSGLSQSVGNPIFNPAIGPINFSTVKCKPGATNNSDNGDDKGKQDRDLCIVVTDIGFANAASSIAALVQSGKFDLRETYIMIAGIAGVDPTDGTLGSAAWARYSVDFGLAHELDSSEKPAGWPYGYTGFGGGGFIPAYNQAPTRIIGTEVYHLNETLVNKAYDLTQGLSLFGTNPATNGVAIATRALYVDPVGGPSFAPARANPTVLKCDSVAVDTYWHGAVLSQRANDWAKLLTGNAANYCMTEEEDNATLTALKRGANGGLLNFDRVMLLRTASNFDQGYPGLSPYDSLKRNSGGFSPSLRNAWLVGSTVAHDIAANWSAWQNGVPAESALSVQPK
jgi:purine nucleoside permease